MLKIAKPVIAVSRRLLNLVGTPLPTEIEERAQLVLEMRARRAWEEFDERVIRWNLRFSHGPFAGQVSYCAFRTSVEGASDCPRGTIFQLDGVVTEGANQVEFGVADNSTLALGNLTSPASVFKDMREAGFQSAPLPLLAQQGSTAAAVTATLQKVLPVASAPAYPIAGQDECASEWGWIFTPRPGTTAGDVLFVRGTAVNQALIGRAWGRIILPR